MENGTYNIKAKSYDENGNVKESSETVIINANLEEGFTIGSYVNYDVEYIDMYADVYKDNGSDYKDANFDATNGWRYLGKNNEGNHLIISTGIPMILKFRDVENSSTETSNEREKWWDLDAENAIDKLKNGILNNLSKIPYEKVSSGYVPSVSDTMIGRFDGTELTDSNNEPYIAVGDYFKSLTHTSKVEKVTTVTSDDLVNAALSATNIELDDIYPNGGASTESRRRAEAYDGSGLLMGQAKGLFNLNYDCTLDYHNGNYGPWDYFFGDKVKAEVNSAFGYSYSVGSVSKKFGFSPDYFYNYGGYRPVIVLSSDVTFEDTDLDGVYEIKY